MHSKKLKSNHQNIKLIALLLVHCNLCAQTRDSVAFSDYYILFDSPLSRNSKIDIGIEKTWHMDKKISFASEISLTGIKKNNFSAESKFNPQYFAFCLQPLHLLIGKRLRFETGVSTSFKFFRYKSFSYPLDTTNNAYNTFSDNIAVNYVIGLRYIFVKQQFALKFLIGPKYIIDLHKNNQYFSSSGVAELGLSWRLRKKIKVRNDKVL